MILPGYFKDSFMDTFGPVAYVLQHCGIYFSVFLFFKLIIGASRNGLKKFSRKLIVFSINNKDPDNFLYYAPRRDFFVDNMILPGYFKDRFMDTFGPVAYVLEHCGIYFSVFLFFKLIIGASRNDLKKFSQKLIVFSINNKDPDSFLHYAPR